MRNLLLFVLGVFLLAQFIRPESTTEPVDPAWDLIALTRPAPDVEQVLRTACYDCHSGQPRYPWYAAITPVNWWLQDHINEGRGHFDATSWGALPQEEQAHVAGEAVDMVQEEEMPLRSYTLLHGDARLTAAQRTALLTYFRGLVAAPGTEGDAAPAEAGGETEDGERD